MKGTIVLDVDGVILLGSEGIPGAGDALHHLDDAGYRIVIATNNATRTPAEGAGRIERLTGYRPDPALVVTSSVAAAGMVTGDDEPVFAAAEPGMGETLRECGVVLTDRIADARTVIVGLDREFTYRRLAEAATAVIRGARLIATNTDATFPTPQGPVPGAGALVAAVERAAGVAAEVAGKPHAPMGEAVARLLGEGPVWMVGDRPETDLAFAHRCGWTPVLALSGVTTDAGAIPSEIAPELVIDRLADLPGLLS